MTITKRCPICASTMTYEEAPTDWPMFEAIYRCDDTDNCGYVQPTELQDDDS